MTKYPLHSCTQSGILPHLFAGSRYSQEVLKPFLGMWPASPSPANNLQQGTPPAPCLHPALTASCPRGGKVSKSSSVAWAACTACMLELMVPVRACWAEVCNTETDRGTPEAQNLGLNVWLICPPATWYNVLLMPVL